MKKTIIIAALVVLCAIPAKAGKVVTDSLYSKALGVKVAYNVYIPNDKDVHRPVLYLLHGLYGTNEDWENTGHTREITDELIASDACCEMIIIMANAGGVDINHQQNGYFNVPGWPYEDFYFNELIPYVEKTYNCGGAKGQRAIAGLSMGGGGSAAYAQRHPDMFSSCYAMSAWFDEAPVAEEDLAKGEEDKFIYTRYFVHKYSPLTYLEESTPEIQEQLRTVRWFIDCGDDDFLFDVNIKAHQLMRDRKIHSELRVRNGVHNWEYWRAALRTCLPFVTRGFDK